MKHYNLEISPPPANGIAVKNEVTGLSYTWPGLSNGVKYKVRAQAVNELGPSDWGMYSLEDNPAGLPAAPPAAPPPPLWWSPWEQVTRSARIGPNRTSMVIPSRRITSP